MDKYFSHPAAFLLANYAFAPPPSMMPMSMAMSMKTTYTYYDYLVVLDFEATCHDTSGQQQQENIRTSPEIIQFPAILVCTRQMAIVDYFDSYVRPVDQPVLSEFCTRLTGITQEMVDKAQPFPKVIRKFEKWLKKHGLSNNGNGRTFALVADGSYDMGHFLYKQTLISNIPFPSYARRWVNIRTVFSRFYGTRWFSLKSVLEIMGLPFEGRQHNGLDDAKNIVNILLRMLMDGAVVCQTEKILLDAEDQEKNEFRILNDKNAGKYDLATVKAVSSQECIIAVFPPNAGGNCVYYQRPPETDFPPYNPHSHSHQANSSNNTHGNAGKDDASNNKENRVPTPTAKNNKKGTRGHNKKHGNNNKGRVSPPGTNPVVQGENKVKVNLADTVSKPSREE